MDHECGAAIQPPAEGAITLNQAYYQRIPVDSIPTSPILNPFFPALHVDSTDFPGRIIPLDLAAHDQPAKLPQAFALYQNYPNPFNPVTDIQFDLARNARVTMKVYNIAGQEVATLLDNRPMNAGAQVVSFDASNLASGVYIYRLNVDGATASKKMVLMK